MQIKTLNNDPRGTQVKKLEVIHESLVNGQRRQMVRQIKEHFSCFSDFAREYLAWLIDIYGKHAEFRTLEYFSDAVISYHVITEDISYQEE